MRDQREYYGLSFRRYRIRPSRAAGRSVGFSLAEMLIAMMILTIGLSMVATIFPAAMTYNQSSADEILGNIICQNGFAVAKARLRHSDNPFPMAMLMASPDLGDDASYPTGGDPGNAGFYVFGAHATSDLSQNDYRILVIAYRKRTAGDNPVRLIQRDVRVGLFDSSVGGNNTLMHFRESTDLPQPGAWMVFFISSCYAKVLSMDPETLTGVINLPYGTLPIGQERVWYCAEKGATESPGIGLMATRTPLRP